MAFSTITSTQIEIGKAVKKELWDKVKANEDDLDSRLVAQESGGSVIELVNQDIINASSAGSLTGLFYYKATYDFTVTSVQVQIYEKGIISSGSVTLDVLKSATLGGTYTSVLSVLPTINFATASDYDSNSGTLNPTYQDILTDEVLRVDITALPATAIGRFRIIITGAL
jgi:hypothetical protein